MSERILAVIKNPGREPYVEPDLENSLEALQSAVGGYIETISIASDAVMIVNEEGWVLELPENRGFGRIFAGTIVVVGRKGDSFCSLPSSLVPYILHALKEKDA